MKKKSHKGNFAKDILSTGFVLEKTLSQQLYPILTHMWNQFLIRIFLPHGKESTGNAVAYG